MKKPLIITIIVLLILIAAGAVAGGVYYYFQYTKTQKILKNPTLSAQLEVENLLSKVGQLIDLPKDEKPTVATVSDVKKLKDQQFFTKAKNGDKVLIYTSAKKAILYDPSINKIIEVAPLNIGQPDVTPAPAVKVALYNGTSIAKLGNTTEQQLKTKISNIYVVQKDNASNSQYKKSIVVDLSGGKQTTAAAQLANILNGYVDTLPSGETKPKNADILIILGSEK